MGFGLKKCHQCSILMCILFNYEMNGTYGYLATSDSICNICNIIPALLFEVEPYNFTYESYTNRVRTCPKDP